MRSDTRSVSSVISTILMVAIAVILAAVVSVFALGIGEDTTEKGPTVGQSSGEFVSDRPGSDDQIVRITHVAGDILTVSELEIVVDATDACGKRARIVGLPTNTLGEDNFEGDDVFDYFSPDGGQLDTSADGEWSAGETARFRLSNTECKVDTGDTVTVRVIHTPTNTVTIEQELTAE